MPSATQQTWEVLEIPVLLAIRDAEEGGTADDLDVGQLALATGIEKQKVAAAIRALYDAAFLTGNPYSMLDGWFLIGMRLLEKGRRVIGQWPANDPYDALVALLETQISHEDDQEKRGKLVGFRDALIGVGQGVATDVLAAFVRQAVGLG